MERDGEGEREKRDRGGRERERRGGGREYIGELRAMCESDCSKRRTENVKQNNEIT